MRYPSAASTGTGVATAVTKAPAALKTKLTAPRTAAIVITLQPEAEEKGVTYAQVLERAEQCVQLEELGIGSGMKIRRAITGARVLELPKVQTPEQACQLTEKLRNVLDGLATVIQPTKCAELRITGLDDCVSKSKVAAAVAKVGNCPVEMVKVGEIRPGPRGMGMAIVKCPIIAAKALSDAGKLLVGWSSAKVEALERRPLRCYKCLGTSRYV